MSFHYLVRLVLFIHDLFHVVLQNFCPVLFNKTYRQSLLLSTYFFYLFFKIFLPYLSSLHEKANCIAIFCTGRPHSLRSCYFRGFRATCLPQKCGDVPLTALLKDTTSELTGLFSTTFPKCRAPSREAVDTIFLKSFSMTRQGE